jgi:aminopeptidase N
MSKFNLILFTFRNTQTSDLWEILSEHADDGFVGMMNQWTKNKGFPVIQVKLEEVMDDTQVWSISQKSCHQKDSDFVWTIPLSYITSSGETGRILIKEKSQIIRITVPEGDHVKFNHDSTTFCRIEYDPESLKILCCNLSDFSIHNRMGLINDVLLSSGSRMMKISYLITIITNMKDKAIEEKESMFHIYLSFDELFQN